MEFFFFGSYEHTMDSKGRVSLPSRFRKGFDSKTVVLAPGPNGQVNVFTPEGFSDWMKSIFDADGGFNPTNPKHDKQRRFFTKEASLVDIDSAGRINVPQSLRERAGLEKDILVNGEEDHVALWDKGRWDAYMGDFDPMDIFDNGESAKASAESEG